MFEYMGDRISNALKNIRGMGKITEENIGEATREIRIALLEADVNYQVVKEFVADVKAKAIDAEVGKSLKPDEVFLKIVKDELVSLLGGDYVPLEVNKKPTILMLVGLQGSGKTTTAGKLANYLRKKHLSPKTIYKLCQTNAISSLDKILNKESVLTNGEHIYINFSLLETNDEQDESIDMHNSFNIIYTMNIENMLN